MWNLIYSLVLLSPDREKFSNQSKITFLRVFENFVVVCNAGLLCKPGHEKFSVTHIDSEFARLEFVILGATRFMLIVLQ